MNVDKGTSTSKRNAVLLTLSQRPTPENQVIVLIPPNPNVPAEKRYLSAVLFLALTVRFITKRFIGEYDQTVENKYKYSTIVDGEQMAFELLDTRSMNEDCGAREDVLKWADGYVLVYSVVSKKSFDLLSEVQKRVEEFKKGASVPIVVLANKADLAHMRQVTQDEGQTFASTLGCPFLELSASEDVTNVTEAFTNLCRDIIEYKRRSRTFFDRVFGAFGREKVSS